MPRRPSRLPAALLAGLVLALRPGAAAARDEPITLADDPFQITDPRPTPPGEASLSVVGAYDRAPRGAVRDTYGAETALSVGVAPDLDLRFGQTGAFGNLDVRRRLGTLGTGLGSGSGTAEEGGRAELGGTTRLGALYQINREGNLPNIGVVGRVRALYGPGQPAYEAELVALFGKTLIAGERPLGVSLNLGVVHRFDPTPNERPNRAILNASIGQAITRDTALVLTYAREQQGRTEQDYSLVQGGIRHRLRDQGAILGLAVGFGLNRDSPRYQVAFGLQWELGGERR